LITISDLVFKTAADARAFLHQHGVTILHQQLRPYRQQTHTILIRLRLADNAHDHGNLASKEVHLSPKARRKPS
jgi:hypothetical protein